MGFSVWLAAKNSRPGFKGGPFKGGDALEDSLPMKSVLCPVGTSANTVSAERERKSCTPEGCRLLSPSARGAAWASWGHPHTCIPQACSAQMLPRDGLCPRQLGRAEMSPGHRGAGAGLAQPGAGPGRIPLARAGAPEGLQAPLHNTGQTRTAFRR